MRLGSLLNKDRWPYALMFMLSAMIFIVGWIVPVPTADIESESYALGFNNRATYIAFAASCLMMLAIPWLSRQGASLEQDSAVNGGPSRTAIRSAMIAAAGGAVLCWLLARHGDYAHSSYFLNRMAYLQAGYQPYTEFEFAYGPALLWIPSLLGQVGLGLASRDAYGLTYVVFTIVGVSLFAFALRESHVNRTIADLLIYALAALSVGFTFIVYGLMYTLLRFTLPLAALAGLNRLYRATERHWAYDLVGPAALVLLCLAVSPEIGLAYVMAGAALLVAIRGERKFWWRLLIGHFSALPIAYAILGDGYLRIVMSFSSGAYSLPVLPGAPSLLVVAAALLASLLLGQQLVRGEKPALLIGLWVLSVVMAAGSFGRADWTHVLGYGIPFMWLLALVGPRTHPRTARVAVALLLILAVVLPVLTGAFRPSNRAGLSHLLRVGVLSALSAGQLATIETAMGRDADWAERVWANLHGSRDVDRLGQFGPLVVPLGADSETVEYLASNKLLVSDYWMAQTDIFTGDALSQKTTILAGLEEHMIVVPVGYLDDSFSTANRKPWPMQDFTRELTTLTAFPVGPPLRHDSLDTFGALRDYVVSNYVLVKVIDDQWAIMEPARR